MFDDFIMELAVQIYEIIWNRGNETMKMMRQKFFIHLLCLFCLPKKTGEEPSERLLTSFHVGCAVGSISSRG